MSVDYGMQSKQARHWILKGLAHVYDKSLDGGDLINILTGLGIDITIAEVERHGAYLEEKGYIEIQKRRVGQLKRKTYRLTAEGLDLLDGNIGPDPGIGL